MRATLTRALTLLIDSCSHRPHKTVFSHLPSVLDVHLPSYTTVCPVFDLSLCFPVQFHFIRQHGFFLIGRTGWKLIIHLGLTKAPFLLKNTELDGVSGYEGREPEVTVSMASVVLLPPGWLCVLDQPVSSWFRKLHVYVPCSSLPQVGVPETLLGPVTGLFNQSRTGP